MHTLRNFVLALFLAIAFVSNISAQVDTKTDTSSEFTQSWRFFSPTKEEFSLDVPSRINMGVINQATQSTTQSRSYRTQIRGTYFFIFSDKIETPNQNSVVSNFALDHIPTINHNELYSFKDRFSYHNKILVIKTDKRIYTFQTVSSEENADDTKRFFDSIKFNDQKISFTENTSLQNSRDKDDNPLTTNQPSVSNNQSQQKIDVASGSATGSGSGSGIPSQPIDAQNGKGLVLNILSKPKPSYTELARFYEITGEVTLRVVFSADAKISNVKVVKGLPFGLNETATQAALAMNFKPVERNGAPVSVRKTILYSFLMY